MAKMAKTDLSSSGGGSVKKKIHPRQGKIVNKARKILGRKQGSEMKLKALVKKIGKKLEDLDDVDACGIEAVITGQTELFGVDGKKTVRLIPNDDDNGNEASPSPKEEDGKEKSKRNGKSKNGKEDEKKKSQKDSKKRKAADPGDDDDVDEWRKRNKIVLRGVKTDEHRRHAVPIRSFKEGETGLHEALCRHCTAVHGYAKPSPIQAQCWPLLLGGVDVVGIAETGSGKTLAFALPALTVMAQSPSGRTGGRGRKGGGGPRLLVLAPTRELAGQVHAVLADFVSCHESLGLGASVVIYGGVSRQDQVRLLRKGHVDCVVATPGRLCDLVTSGDCDLSGVRHVVLDEADRMLDLGFEEAVRSLLQRCPPPGQRRTAMFSATWPLAIQTLAAEHLSDPCVRVYVGFDFDDSGGAGGTGGGGDGDDGDEPQPGSSLSANRRVVQNVEVLEDRDRYGRLKELLRTFYGGRTQKTSTSTPYRVLVFCLYKKEAARIEASLSRESRCPWSSTDVCSIHGDKGQADRQKALDNFRSGTCPLMVATDVAARGLDIPDVEVVVNYTFPLTIEDYVHRIGRTGRAGKTGISHTFFQPTDKGHAGELQRVMAQAGQPIPEALKKFGNTIKKKEHSLYGNFGPKNGPPITKKATKITFDF